MRTQTYATIIIIKFYTHVKPTGLMCTAKFKDMTNKKNGIKRAKNGERTMEREMEIDLTVTACELR